MGHIIAILSGRGGMGKTGFSAGISGALARAGKRVLAIDCSPGLPDLDIALGLTELAALNFMEVSRGAYPLSRASRHPELESLYFLTAPFRRTDVDEAAFHAMLEQATEEFDYIILDSPAGPELTLTAAPAHRCVVVTVPEKAAARGAAQISGWLEKMGKNDTFLVVNRVKKRLFSRPQLTVDDIMDQTGLPLLGLVPEDGELSQAAAEGKSVITQTNRGASRAFEAIAQRLMGNNVPLTIH